MFVIDRFLWGRDYLPNLKDMLTERLAGKMLNGKIS